MRKPWIVLWCLFVLCVYCHIGSTKQTRPPLSRDPFFPPTSIKKNKIHEQNSIVVHGIISINQQRAVVMTVGDVTETLYQGQSLQGYRVHTISKKGLVIEHNKQFKKYNFDE